MASDKTSSGHDSSTKPDNHGNGKAGNEPSKETMRLLYEWAAAELPYEDERTLAAVINDPHQVPFDQVIQEIERSMKP